MAGMTWIKICGITRKSDAAAIAELGADCLGFIFSTDSPRRIGPGQAREISEGLEGISKAGVFVNENIEKIKSHIGVLGLDFVQLSGDEDLDYIKKLKDITGKVKIIKVLRVKKGGDAGASRIAEKYLEFADHILIDSYNKYQYGGTGKTVDWDKVKGIVEPEKLIVSGGLYHGNAAKAIEILRPYGVDASSRLEVSPGVKDLEMVGRFIKKVKDFERLNKDRI
jgi:phosphoribosylanthranilate isomerase